MVGSSGEGETGNRSAGKGKVTVIGKNDGGSAGSGDSREGLSVDAVSISLRRAYETTLEEEVPDSLMDLLRKLD